MSFKLHVNSTANSTEEGVGGSSSAVTAEISTPAQCETTSQGRNSTRRQKELPGKLAKLKGAQECFVVNGEKWVLPPPTTRNAQRANGGDPPQQAPHNRYRPIRAARDLEMQVDPPLEQPENRNSHDPTTESSLPPGTNFSTVATHAGLLDSGELMRSPLEIDYWAHIGAYLPPRNSLEAVPRALLGTACGTCSEHLLAFPNVQHQPQDTTPAQEFAAAVSALAANSSPVTQMRGSGIGQHEVHWVQMDVVTSNGSTCFHSYSAASDSSDP